MASQICPLPSVSLERLRIVQLIAKLETGGIERLATDLTPALARLLARQPRVAVATTYHGVRPDRVPRAVRALTLSSDVVVSVTPAMTRALRAAGLSSARSATVL